MHTPVRFVLTIALVLGVCAVATPAAADSSPPKRCTLPEAGEAFETARPEEVGLDPAALQQATSFATSRARTSVRIFRHNCLVSVGGLNDLTDHAPLDLWSSTKSIVSLAAGIAVDQGKLRLDDRIGEYLPERWVDAAHRPITVRNLLQENSGIKTSILSEVGTAGLDTHIVKQGLALPVEYRPGTYFEYGQRNPDILAYIVGRAVGMDIQDFTQKYLFDPIGIRKSDYTWQRDRADNTYGFAHMLMKPDDFARIGLLLENNGTWNDRRVVSASYLRQATEPSGTNACYGMLFWVNDSPCISPSVPSRRTYDASPMPIFGEKAFATIGFLQQNNFVAPEQDTLVSWTGAGGDVSADPQTLMTASPNSELYYEFFRRLGPAYTDQDMPTVPPYETEVDYTVTPGTVADPRVALGALGVGPYAPEGCTALGCN